MKSSASSDPLESVVIHQLRELAVELKRTPTARDISAAASEKKCPRLGTIRRMFGNFHGALAAARLPVAFDQEFSESELIAQLQDLSEFLGRPLTKRDVSQAARNGTCAKPTTFVRVFGSASNAFSKAGVQPLGRYSKSDLIGQYRSLSKELGRPARISDINDAARKGRCAPYDSFKRAWNGLTEARRVAGLLQGATKRYSRGQLIDQLKRLARDLDRIPTSDDVRAAAARGETAGLKTFQTYFGGHNKALREAGLQINKPSAFSRGHLIMELQRLAKKLGRRPSLSEVDRASQEGLCPCATTYAHYFGSFAKALEAARLVGMADRRGITSSTTPVQYTRSEIAAQLRKLGEHIGRRPTIDDVTAASKLGECAGVTTIVRHFGRFSAALKEAGFDRLTKKNEARARLVTQLQELTRELRRIPTARDLEAAQGRCSTPMTFVRNFGSMAEARRAARVAEILKEVGAVGKEPRVGEKFQRHALIAYMRTLAERLGKPPSVDDVIRACRESGGPGAAAFRREFGGVPAARRESRVDDVLRRAEVGQRTTE